MRKVLKYSFLTVAWILIILTAVIVLALGIIQTKEFKEKLVSIIKNKAPEYINGNLTIGQIEGDFFTRLILKDVLLLDTADTLLYIPQLEASYNLLSLFNRRLTVENFKILNPYINLRQINDSVWNVQQIVKPSKPAAPVDSLSAGKPFDIELGSIVITNGAINIHSPDTILPKQLQRINSKSSFSMVNNLLTVQMDSFSLLTVHPDLEVKKIVFNLKQTPELISISNLFLGTQKNQLEGKIEYYTDNKKKSTAVLKTSPLHLDEFKYYLSGYKLPANPIFNLEGSMQNDSVNAVMDLSDQKQSIHLKILSPNLYQWLSVKSDSLLRYQLAGKLENIKISHWMDYPQLNYILNGNFTAEGQGTDPKTVEVKAGGNFDHLMIEGRKIDLIRTDLDYNKGDVQGTMQGNGNFGNFSLTADARNLLKEPSYKVNLITKNLDIGPLTGIDTLNSAINMTAEIKGRGFDPKSLSANAVMDVTESRIQKINVSAIKASAQYQKENLNIDSLHLQTQTLDLKARGNYSLKAASDISLTADLQNMDEFSSLIPPLQDLKTSGHLEAHLTGQADSLNIDAKLNLPQLQYGEYLTGPVLVFANGGITPSDTTIHARILSKDLSSGDFKLDSVSFTINKVKDLADITGHLVNNDLDTRFQTNLQFGELTKINLNDLAINYKNQKWNLDQPSAVIEIGPKNYKITNFSLSNARGDSIQSILAEGNINREGKENFSLDIKNIDIKKLTELANQKIDASGILNLNAKMEGTSGSPILKGNFAVSNAVFNDFPFKEVGGTFDYNSNRMKMGMKIMPRDSGKFELTGTMPLQLNLDSMNFKFNRKDSVNVSLTAEKFPLAAIKTIDLVKQITGYLEGAVQMRGSIESPDLKGNLQLKKASVKVPEYGIDYRDILFDVDFIRDKIRLDTLRIRTDKGSMTGTGELNFTSDFYKGNIGSSEVSFKFNGFKPINHREVNMEVTGNSSLKGEKGKFVFDGNLEVPKSEIYLPALFNMLGKANTPEIPEPLLIQAMDSTKGKLDTLVTKSDTAQTDTAKVDYFKNLKGKLRFKIPKNSWIKNENMYVEISGDLELRKEQQFFELFGNVDVVRGQYELLGRKFVIDKGAIQFEGGEEMMPNMSIQASYNFRNTQGVTQKLSVDIHGMPDSLGVEFTLDNNSINEGDALSYILFGKSMNELTLDQQQGMAGTGGTMAEAVAASLVSSQLTKFLGSKLNVDYLEIKSEGGFENASLTVGKYITKDLFASYEQQFGQTDIKGIPSYQLNLEYEVLKFLYLRMNNSSIDNGFDVIFKFEGK